MDKVLSTRVDAALIDDLDRTTKQLGTTKKRFLEEAIRLRIAAVEECEDVWAATAGAWGRAETPGQTVRHARDAFEGSARRHRRESGT